MRRLLSLTALLLLCAGSGFAQAPAEITGTISAAGVDCSTATRCVILPLGQATGTGLIAVGAFTGTIAVEVSADNSAWTSPAGGTTSITTAGSYYTSLQGARWLRVRASTLSSGTPAIVLSATPSPFYGSVAVTGTATVSGTVTSNAGTNLNTSLLAVETGGNLAAIKADADKIPALGQALAAASVPVVLTATQITTLTPPAAITGFALDATLTGRLPAGGSPANGESNTNTNLSRIGGYNFIYNGATWDRWTGAVTNATAANFNVQAVGNVAAAIADSGNPIKVGGVFNTSPPTYTNGQRGDLQLDANGFVKVNVAAGGASGGTSSSFGSAFPATGTAIGFLNSAGTNMAAGNLDASGFLKVNVAAGGGAGGTSSNIGSAVPTPATYAGFNDGTNMQGARVVDLDTGAGTVYGLVNNLVRRASGGPVELIGSSTSANSLPVVIASDQGALPIAGGKTNNNAAPGATNVGALSALANAAAPSWTEGNQVLESVDLHGSLRITAMDSTGTAITPTTLATHDGALTPASTTGGVLLLRASAAAPANVSAGDDAVLPWALLNGSQVVNLAAGGNLIGATANALDVNIKSGAGSSGTAVADEAAFTQGTTQITPIGGLFKTSYTALTSGQAGIAQMTSNGGLYTNLDKVQGTNVDVNSGTKSAGTVRVVLATDQPQLTNKLLVTPDSVALPANQSVNINQVGGAAMALGQQLAAASLPVVLTAAQITTLTPPTTVTANAGTNLNTSLLALETGGNLATVASAVRAEDTASADADKGIGALAIRKAAPANTSSTDGDYEYLQMNAGRLWTSSVIDTALPAGTNVIGHVIADTGSTTAVTGTVTTQLPTAAAAADGATNPTAPFVVSANALWNGATWDRWKSAGAGLNTTGTGIAAAQIVGQFDDVSPTAITENQFGNLRMSANRNLYGVIRDGAGNERSAGVTVNNALVVEGTGANALVGVQVTQGSAVGGVTLNAVTGNTTGTTVTLSAQPVIQYLVKCVACGGGTTVTFQASPDSGANWLTVNAWLTGSNTIASSTTTAGTTVWNMPAGIFTNYRANVSSYSAGTITVEVDASGVGAMTQVVIANQGTANGTPWNENIAQFGGTAVSLGKQLSAASIPVVHASDDPVVAALAQLSNALRTTGKGGFLGSFGRPVTSTGDALDVNVKYPVASLDACAGVKKNVAISLTGNALLVTGATARRYAICSIILVNAAAENISLVEGSGSTCGTGTTAVIGSTTAANGPNLGANGGFSAGSGNGTIAIQNNPGNDICLLKSGAGVVAGNMTIAAQQ